VAAAAQAVAAGQQQLDAALNTATVALNQAAAACLGGDGGQATAANSACASALQASLQAQQQVQAATSEVAQQETTLATLLSSSSASSSAGSQSQQAQAPQASQSSGGSARTGSGGSASQSSAPTGAELVADQSAVDAAQAEVTAAQQNLAQATIVSPIDGTVAAVNLTGGAQVSAGSSFANVVVVGPGGFEVTTTVPVTEVGMVKLGDSASVVPDGTSQAFDGKVVSIGVSPTTSGTTTNYGVIVGLDGSPANLHNGASAAVAITVQQSNDALTVPTSAVRTAGGGAVHVVSVVSRGKTSPVPVQVGTIGSELTEIRSGLREGQEVMLADMTQPLPSATLPNRFGGFGGGLGGGFGGTFGGGGAGGTAVRGAGAGGRPGG
jgi:HlyD family secretion protein